MTAIPAPQSAGMPEPAGVPLADLPAFGCRYAVTPDNAGPRDHRFCGARALPGKSWCAAHAETVFSVREMGGLSRAQARARARIRAAESAAR